jgi:hypothetical protein
MHPTGFGVAATNDTVGRNVKLENRASGPFHTGGPVWRPGVVSRDLALRAMTCGSPTFGAPQAPPANERENLTPAVGLFPKL